MPNANELTLEPVGEEDADRCLFADLVNTHVKVAFDITADALQREDCQFFWAKLGQEIVGTTGFTLRTPLLIEMRKTMILPELRQQGMGAMVISCLENHCRLLGIRKVIATVYATNIPMLTLRLKLGYRVEGFHPDHEAPGFDEYTLSKFLTKD